MDPINKNSYAEVRSRIRSQIFNRILKKPNPDTYEMVSSVSGTSKSLGGGISLPDRIKDLLGFGVHNNDNNSSANSNGPRNDSDSSGMTEISNSGEEKESETNENKNNKESNISRFSTPGSTGSRVRPDGPESGGGVGEERETFISLSNLAKFIGTDRKKLQRASLQYSMVYGEGLYDVGSNSYQIPLRSAAVLVLGKKMVERGESKSYREAFRTIKDESNEEIKSELKQIEESIRTYVRESKSESEAKEEVQTREDEKEALGVVGAIAEALIEASSSITNRINEIENSILDFHYAFLKIKQEVESVRGELERIEKMVTEYLVRNQR